MNENQFLVSDNDKDIRRHNYVILNRFEVVVWMRKDQVSNYSNAPALRTHFFLSKTKFLLYDWLLEWKVAVRPKTRISATKLMSSSFEVVEEVFFVE